ncbi:tuftelin isoform X1 [Malaclemys terrapin pileata]|uniref:tuftelin isoform X1 n=2 Tax=Malaclemys terrapin pileata TaxID=2991368 RepID=UPI0023A869F5|nr:tuftelin isoform X1 [Malaclemys terrapin pileata]
MARPFGRGGGRTGSLRVGMRGGGFAADASCRREEMAFWRLQSQLALTPEAEGGQEAPCPDAGGEEEEGIFCQDSVKVLRLTLQNDLPGKQRDQVKQKPVGRAFAMVANRSSNGHSLASECIKSSDGHEEIIKVYLKARAEDKVKHEQNVCQLKSEVRYIQEARSSLKKLREDISSKLESRQGAKTNLQCAKVMFEKQNGICKPSGYCHRNSLEDQEDDYSGEDIEKIRETAKRFFTKLQEAEKRHQSDKTAFEMTTSQYQKEIEQTSAALKKAEEGMAEKEVKLEEVQRLMSGMEKEHQSLLLKMKEGEAELEKLRSLQNDKLAEQDRSAKLEKEVATLREKIHHLDDMLKSQQRKVRQMIEQLQNSKTVIHAKDVIIQELKERVAYLEAENLEMHDRIEHLIEKQTNPGSYSTRARSKSESASSKRLAKPLGPKPLPLIRVLET